MSSPQSVLRKSKLTLRSRLVLVGVIAIIYIVACCCPALRLDHYYSGDSSPQSNETWLGWTALVLGWLGIFVGSVAWLANACLGLTLIFLLCGLRWASLISSVLAALISFDFFQLFSAKIPADEGGVGTLVLRSPEIGVWLWFASIAGGFVAALILFLAPRTTPRVAANESFQPRMDTNRKQGQRAPFPRIHICFEFRVYSRPFAVGSFHSRL